MGYPSNVFSPAVRSNGQTIDASHVNDLQAEVTALETALLGTITHSVNVSGNSTLAKLSASNSTLATLQVSGASTLTGTVNVVGGSTFAVRPVTPPPEAVRVQSTIVNLANDSSLALPWTHSVYATNSSMHSTGTNPERLTPQSTGIYQITASVKLSALINQATSVLRLRILDSSGAEVGGFLGHATTFPLVTQAVSYKRFDVVTDTQWVRVEVTVRDGSTASASTDSFFAMHKL